MNEIAIVKESDQLLVVPSAVSFEQWWEFRHEIRKYRVARERLKVREPLHAMDWIMRGEDLFGERASVGLDFLEETLGWNHATYAGYRKVVERFPPERRQEGLTISHYKAVMDLPPRTADALLEEAAERHWPVPELRAIAKAKKTGEEIVKPPSKEEIRDVCMKVLADLKPDGDAYELGPYWAQELARLFDFSLVPLVLEEQEEMEL